MHRCGKIRTYQNKNITSLAALDCDKLCNPEKHPVAWGLGACPERFRVREILKLPAVLVLLSHKRTPVNDEKIRNTDICFN